jgi:hypothetical protein
MTRKDDRTPEQRKTHRIGVVMRDNFLSGWGRAAKGYSRCAWALDPSASLEKLHAWVKSRSDSSYVNVIRVNQYRPSRGTAHYHIYVCGPDHPSQVSH